MDFEKLLYNACIQDKCVIPKAIANFMFREIIEDAHSKYGISQDDMQEMCRTAVNRAAALETALSTEDLRNALVLYGYSTAEWEAPNPQVVEEELSKLRRMADAIK